MTGGFAARATAQPAQQRTFDLDSGWRPSADGEGLVGVEDTLVPGPWRWNLGFFGVYQRLPLVVQASRGEVDVVAHRLSTTLLFQLGLGERFAVGLAAPFVAYQEGDAGNVGSGTALPQVATGDVALSFKWRFLGRAWDVERLGREGYGVAFLGRVSLPTGNDEAFATAGTWTLETGFAADLALPILHLGGSVQVRVRGEETTYFDARFGHALVVSAGGSAMLPPVPRLSVFAEVHAQTELDDLFAAPTTPVELDLGLRWQTPGDVVLSLGGGLGVTDAVGAPAGRVFAGVHWAPRRHDRDDDGIPDELDLCPPLAEDRDGVEDDDGCPDPDDDSDGIDDDVDRCRGEPEDEDGFEDGDGCPDPDNDQDGVLDESDRCPGQPEDRDGFEDDDGCPDLDDDGDGIPDASDRCRLEREDADGHDDGDGCPDPDDDDDGVPDAQDRCPLVPEDRDGTDDDDGCPEDDNDHDGVLDAADRCPTEAEDIDGVDDDDGCPEPGGRALVQVPPTGWLVLRGSPRFGRDGALAASSRPLVDQLARHARSTQATLTIWAPRGDARLEQQAAWLRDALVARGVAAERIELGAYADDPADDQDLPRFTALTVRLEWIAPAIPRPQTPR